MREMPIYLLFDSAHARFALAQFVLEGGVSLQLRAQVRLVQIALVIGNLQAFRMRRGEVNIKSEKEASQSQVLYYKALKLTCRRALM